MGCMASKPDYINSAAGGESEYLANYLEGEILGQVRDHERIANDGTSVHSSVPLHHR